MTQDQIIKNELLETFREFDRLRDVLLYNPKFKPVRQYMAEWDLQHEWQIEENLEQREESALCEAAKELNITPDELNIWLCDNI